MTKNEPRAAHPSARAPQPLRRALTLAALGLAACSSAPKTASLNGSISAAPDLNPSVSQRPSPLQLRIYELRTAAAFNQADFVALYQADTATLGADLVAREELMLQPGETRPYARPLAADTRFIGVVALYRLLEKATWRVVVPVQPGRPHTMTIRAEALAVRATATR